jgi:hypothetical protein
MLVALTTVTIAHVGNVAKQIEYYGGLSVIRNPWRFGQLWSKYSPLFPFEITVTVHYYYYYYYYYYYPVITFLRGIYNYIPERNKLSFYCMYCYSYSVFTICAIYNVISPVKYGLYF